MAFRLLILSICFMLIHCVVTVIALIFCCHTETQRWYYISLESWERRVGIITQQGETTCSSIKPRADRSWVS